MINVPPAHVVAPGCAAPSSTAETLANTTSDSMISDVVCAGRRAAPYCSARLPNRKAAVSASSQGSQLPSGACGMAPVVMVNDTVHQRVKPARVGELVNQILAGGAVAVEKEQA